MKPKKIFATISIDPRFKQFRAALAAQCGIMGADIIEKALVVYVSNTMPDHFIDIANSSPELEEYVRGIYESLPAKLKGQPPV